MIPVIRKPEVGHCRDKKPRTEAETSVNFDAKVFYWILKVRRSTDFFERCAEDKSIKCHRNNWRCWQPPVVVEVPQRLVFQELVAFHPAWRNRH